MCTEEDAIRETYEQINSNKLNRLYRIEKALEDDALAESCYVGSWWTEIDEHECYAAETSIADYRKALRKAIESDEAGGGFITPEPIPIPLAESACESDGGFVVPEPHASELLADMLKQTGEHNKVLRAENEELKTQNEWLKTDNQTLQEMHEQLLKENIAISQRLSKCEIDRDAKALRLWANNGTHKRALASLRRHLFRMVDEIDNTHEGVLWRAR